MTQGPDLPPVGVRAAAAGRWVAQACNLLAHHPNQGLSLSVKNKVASAGAKPSWGIGPHLTAHMQLAHAKALAPQAALDLFGACAQHRYVELHKTGFANKPDLNIGAALGKGSIGIRNSTGGSWLEVAQILGLFCEALAEDTPFHRTLLSATVGHGREKQPAYEGNGWGVLPWIEMAVQRSAQVYDESVRGNKPFFVLEPPFIGNTEQRRTLLDWMHATLETSFERSKSAFEGCIPQLPNEAQDVREPNVLENVSRMYGPA